MTSAIPVYLNPKTKAVNLIAMLSMVALPLGLFLYGWFFQDTAAALLLTAFGVFVGGGTLLFIRRARILRFDSAPVFTLRPEALEISPDNTLPWTVFKDAVVFTFEGDKSIGLRLRDDLDRGVRSEIEARFADTLSWQMFRLPVTVDYSSLSLSGDELVEQLRKHGLKVTMHGKEIFVGDKSDLVSETVRQGEEHA
jgi:hypothetical protein